MARSDLAAAEILPGSRLRLIASSTKIRIYSLCEKVSEIPLSPVKSSPFQVISIRA